MNRRDFLKSLLAVGAVTVAGKLITSPDEIPWMPKFLRTGQLHGQCIVLYETFVVDTDLDVSITNCHFSAEVPLRYLIHIKRAPNMVISNCVFVGATNAAIFMDTGVIQPKAILI